MRERSLEPVLFEGAKPSDDAIKWRGLWRAEMQAKNALRGGLGRPPAASADEAFDRLIDRLAAKHGR